MKYRRHYSSSSPLVLENNCPYPGLMGRAIPFKTPCQSLSRRLGLDEKKGGGYEKVKNGEMGGRKNCGLKLNGQGKAKRRRKGNERREKDETEGKRKK